MNRVLYTAAFLLASLFATTQKPTPAGNPPTGVLSEGAQLLFQPSASRLTVAEKNILFQRLGLQVSPDHKGFRYKELPVKAEAFPTDLNKDGVEEVFVVLEGPMLGDAGCTAALFLRSDGHGYQRQEEVRGGQPIILETQSGGYPDLVIGGPDFEFPVYRWNGKAYVFLRNMSDDELQNSQTWTVEEYSRRYREGIRE